MEKKRSPFSLIMDYAGAYKSKYVCSVVLAVLSVISGMVPYLAVAKMVTAMIDHEDKEISFFVLWCTVAAAGYILKGIFNGISTSVSHTATFLTMKDIRQKLIAKLTRMPMGTILESPSGYYKDVIVDRVEGIEVPLAHLLPEMTANVLGPVLMLIYLFTLDRRLALISLITIPVGMGVMSTTMKSYGENYGRSVEIGGRLTNAIVEYMGGIEVIKAFSQSKSSYEKYESAVNDNAAFFYNWMKSAQWAMSAYNAITPSVLLTVLPFGFLFYASGSLEASAFVTMIILALGLLEPLIAAMNYTDNIARVGAVMGQIYDVLASPEIERGSRASSVTGGDIEFRNVSFSYDNEKNALKNISLTIPEGRVTALVGASGSGKSTVAKLIAGFWDVSEGKLLFGVTLLTFFYTSLSPVDAAQALAVRRYARPTEEQVTQVRHELGLDKPMPQQYADWLARAVKGDFGVAARLCDNVAVMKSGQIIEYGGRRRMTTQKPLQRQACFSGRAYAESRKRNKDLRRTKGGR